MAFSIQVATEDHAQGIIDVLNPLIKAGTNTTLDTPYSLQAQLDYMRQFPEDAVFHVATCNKTNDVLGLQSIEPLSNAKAHKHIGDISTFVAPDSQRSGIGLCLTQATIQSARAIGIRKLIAQVRADNPRAIAFYQSQGFSPIGTAHQHALVHDQYIDITMLEMWLG